jgi:hypothetical protein
MDILRFRSGAENIQAVADFMGDLFTGDRPRPGRRQVNSQEPPPLCRNLSSG